jgi:hypothetical protein
VAFAGGLFSTVASGYQFPPNQSMEYQVKAAFLLNFARYITWPSDTFSNPAAPLTICVPELNPFGPVLEQMVAGETVGERPVEIRTLASPASAAECHVLFVPRTVGEQMERWLAPAQKRPVVTVGEATRFIPAGGIINLLNMDGRIRFEVNGAAARRNGLDVSSRLLALAVPTSHE